MSGYAPHNPYAPPAYDFDRPPLLDEPVMALPASRGARFMGRMIDQLLLVVSVIPFFIAASEFPADIAIAYMLLVFPIGLVGYQWYLIATSGQSLGKKAMKTRIVRVDGSPVGFLHGVVLRNWVIQLVGALPYVGGLASLVNALMIFGQEHRCGHDHIAGTRVVDASFPTHF